MTTKQYRTAMCKTVDMGALILQNEQVRAVGNMNVNARGDKLDSTNRVIDKKTRQISRQYQKQVNSQTIEATTSNAALRRSNELEQMAVDPADTFTDIPEDVADTENAGAELQGGLAAAIAKAKTVQQTKLPTPRESARSGGVRKL
jgi:deoxycytidylate deaminase